MSTVTAAFVADPAFRFFFPDDASYPRLVGRFAGYLFDKRLARGAAWVVEGGAAVSLWDRRSPDAVDVTTDGGPALGLPDEVLQRLDAWDAAVHRLIPVSPLWYLGILATDPAQAGRGLGRAAMAAGLAQALADGLPAYLETATQANVELYARHGWDVVGTSSVGPVTATVMRHPGGSG